MHLFVTGVERDALNSYMKSSIDQFISSSQVYLKTSHKIFSLCVYL